MKAEYKRDMNHNYLILTGEERIDTDSYQVRMIVANAVPDLLQCRIQGMDGKFMVYYDVTSRQPLTTLYEDRKLGIKELQVILSGFIQVMEEMSEYLLNPCQLILEPEYIYMDAEKKNVRFCYLPGFQGEVQKQFQSLAEYFLPRLDHEDGRAVMLGYGVYRRALEDSFHLEHIKEELYKVREGAASDFEDYEKKPAVVMEEKNTLQNDAQKELWQMENWERENSEETKKIPRKNKKKNNSETTETGNVWKPVIGFMGALFILLAITIGMAMGYIPRVSVEVFLGIVLLLMSLGMLSYVLLKKITENKKDKNIVEENPKRAEEWEKENTENKQNTMASGSIDTDINENAKEKKQELLPKRKKTEKFTEEFCETVVLSSGAVKGPATLVSREPGELATIYLEQDITVIGKLETAADAVINIPTVSRIHAKIRKRDGEYYLTDLNSRNGTCINGQILKTGEDHLLENEDEVDFAQARYIFLK